MSEYQYYEFRTVDRSLTRDEMGALRKISSRADITPERLSVEYQWGDFKGDVEALMTTTFDAMVWVSNFGCHEFRLRVPCALVDPKTIARYLVKPHKRAKVVADDLLIEFRVDDDEREILEDIETGEGLLDSLLPVRAELMSGDLRPAYLAWLAEAGNGAVRDEAMAPPIPAGLRDLTEAQEAFAQFLGVDSDLLAAAAEGSAPRGASSDEEAERERTSAWLASVSAGEKERWLLEIALGHERTVRGEMASEILAFAKKAASRKKGRQVTAEKRGSTVDELLARAEVLRGARLREEAERREAAREKRFKALAEREPDAWREVEAHIETKRPAGYDRAMKIVLELQKLYAHRKDLPAFTERIRSLRERHRTKSGVIYRLRDAKIE